MATIVDLVRAGQLAKFDANLDHDQQEFREIYAAGRFVRWVSDELPAIESTWNVESSPLEQLDALVMHFCAGDTLHYGWQFKPLRHVRDGVWELKTADLRVFGWFSRRDCFVAVCGDTKDRIKLHNLYSGYRDEVIRFRNRLDLDQPKFVSGDNPHAVVSDYAYP